MPWFIVAFWVGTILGAAYLYKNAGKNNQPPPGIEEFKGPTAEAGREIPFLQGSRWVKNYNCLWWGDVETIPIRKKGGKK